MGLGHRPLLKHRLGLCLRMLRYARGLLRRAAWPDLVPPWPASGGLDARERKRADADDDNSCQEHETQQKQDKKRTSTRTAARWNVVMHGYQLLWGDLQLVVDLVGSRLFDAPELILGWCFQNRKKCQSFV